MLIAYQDLTQEAVYSLAREWIIANLSDVETEPDIENWTQLAVGKVKAGELLIEYGEETQTVQLIGKASDKLKGFPS